MALLTFVYFRLSLSLRHSPFEHLRACSSRRVSGLQQCRLPANCAYTAQHADPDKAQVEGASASAGLGIPNGGLQVVNPSREVYNLITSALASDKATEYDFADQSLLGDLFPGRWVALPYIYNALKTMKWPDVHSAIWKDSEVKNIHYILSPKPWDSSVASSEADELTRRWLNINDERIQREAGISDK